MEQAMDRKSRQNPLARQAELNAPSFRKLTLIGFGSLSDEVVTKPAERYLRGIPPPRDNFAAGPSARDFPQRQVDFALQAQRTVTADSPVPDAEEVISLASLADTYANDPFWDNPHPLGHDIWLSCYCGRANVNGTGC